LVVHIADKVISILKPFLLHKVPCYYNGHQEGKYYGNIKCVRCMRIGYFYIHAIDACYKSGQRKNDRNRSKPLHYVVQVVADNTCKRIERTAKDVCINVCHFKSLAGIYNNIIEDFPFFFGQAEKVCTFHL